MQNTSFWGQLVFRHSFEIERKKNYFFGRSTTLNWHTGAEIGKTLSKKHSAKKPFKTFQSIVNRGDWL